MLLVESSFEKLKYRLDRFWTPYYRTVESVVDKELLEDKAEELRKTWKMALKLHREYLQNTFSFVGWVKSFIPNSAEYKLRYQLSHSLLTASNLLDETKSVAKNFLRQLNNTSSQAKQTDYHPKALTNILLSSNIKTTALKNNKRKSLSAFFAAKKDANQESKIEFYYVIREGKLVERRSKVPHL